MIRLLLDTNVVLWYFWGSNRVDDAKGLIESGDSQIFVSAVSWWEIAIKVRTGKLRVDLRELRSSAAQHGFQELPINGLYTEALLELPALHKDPFDHMLLAQAITEPMRLITGDALLADYSSLVMVI
jgi:PIN domain nuclease of toxin-antitoxin system